MGLSDNPGMNDVEFSGTCCCRDFEVMEKSLRNALTGVYVLSKLMVEEDIEILVEVRKFFCLFICRWEDFSGKREKIE